MCLWVPGGEPREYRIQDSNLIGGQEGRGHRRRKEASTLYDLHKPIHLPPREQFFKVLFEWNGLYQRSPVDQTCQSAPKKKSRFVFFLHFFWIPLGFPPGPSNLTGLRGPSLAVYSHAVCAVFPPLDLPQVSSSQTHSFTHNPAYTSSPFPSTA